MNEEFSFGTLATDDLRLQQIKQQHTGLNHLNRITPLDPLPGQPVKVLALSGGGFILDRVICRYSIDHSSLQSSSATEVPMQATSTEWDTLTWSYLTTWEVTLPPQPAKTMVHYQILGFPRNGAQPWVADHCAEFRYYVDDDPPPAWSKEAIIYQIFVDRFYPGHGNPWKPARTPADYYGGTLQGITQKLDYLCRLGVNCLWLSPCYPSPTHHGYDITDLYQIEPRLGTITDLQELVREAHTRGIRVLLDFVANHTSHMHPIFKAALSDENSPYHNWFTWKQWPEEYQSFFGVREMPNWNLDHPAAREHVIGAAVHWIRECDVDGYRLDYAYGPKHDFWVDFRKAIREVKPDVWIFGEIVETPELQRSFAGRLDGALDFLLSQALRGLFAFGSWDVTRFEAFLTEHERYFPPDFSLPTFLDNHDINRFSWVTRGNADRLKLAALCQFTLSGPPIIYYGTEVGLSQDRDIRQNGLGILEESRLPMLWGGAQDQELLSYYQRLIQIRRQNPVLWQSPRQCLYEDAKTGLYAYQYKHGQEVAVVLLNVQPNTRTLALPDIPRADVLIGDDCRVNVSGEVEIELQPWQGKLFLHKGPANPSIIGE